MSFAEILQAAVSNAADEAEARKHPRPARDAQIMELREIFANYGKNPFKVGDLVTPRANTNMKGAGEPHLVVDICDAAPADFSIGEVGTCLWGGRPDIRVGSLWGDNSTYSAHWTESWQFVRYELTE